MTDRLKQQLVEVAKLAYDKGLVNAHEGNLSLRAGDKVYITPSGVCKGFLEQDMIAVTDLNGKVLEGTCKPSSEIRLHLLTYAERPDIGAVVHSHAPYTTAYAVANKPIKTKAYPEMIVFFGEIPLADYGTQSTDEIFHGVKKYIGNHEVVLLANHGVMTVGKDIYDAFFKLEVLKVLQGTYTGKCTWGRKELPEEKLIELYNLRNGKKSK
jgi:L-fuculose-phosphate aldolase